MSIDISDVTRRIQYSGSAGTGPYQFAFEILAQTDVAVYVDETLQTLTTDYTVTINGDGTGSITLVVAATGANTITIIGDRAIARSTDFVTGGDLLADSLNDELDSLTIYCQQLEEKFARCFAAPEYDTADTLVMPDVADRASKYLAFDADGNVVATSGTTSTIIVSTFAETLLDDTTAAGMRTTIGAAASGANTDITSLNAPALGAATATTQSASDNTTKVATTAMVQAAIDASTPTTTRTTFTASGNLTIPAGVTQVIVTGQAPGGGGGGSTDGGDGGDLTFGPNGGAVVLTLGGGKKGTARSGSTPGAGGAGGGSGLTQGKSGRSGQSLSNAGGVVPDNICDALGGQGGSGMFGELGCGGHGGDGTNRTAAGGGGGGAGEQCFSYPITVTPSTQYDVTIGSVGSAGTGASAGKGGFFVVEYTTLG